MALAERVQRVRLLLETLNDPYPTPHGALRPDAGPAPARYVPCETCKRRGWLRRRDGYVLCLGCDGRGWRRRERVDEPWDAYLELPLAEAAQLPREPTRRPVRDAPAGAQEPPYAWERQRQAYDRHGSYKELRRQLDALARAHPYRHALVCAVHVNHETRRLDAHAARELELGVLTLALKMRTVRVPPWLIERTQAEERRETIETLAARGLGAGEIARRLGATKRSVRRRLKEAPTRGVDLVTAGVPFGAT